MSKTLGRALFSLVTLALMAGAAAQHPLIGSWQETAIGFVVTFEQQPNGQLAGVLQGQDAPMPLNIASDPRGVQGTFVLDGQTLGFAAQLQADDTTLLIWLYEVDGAGQAIQTSYEQYTAYRVPGTGPTAAAPAGALSGAQPGAPAGAPLGTQPQPPFGGAAAPVQPGGAPFGGAPAPVQPGANPGAPFGGAATPVAPGQPPAPGPFGGAVAPGQPGAPTGFGAPAAAPGGGGAIDLTGTWQADSAFDDGTPYAVRLTFDGAGNWQMEVLVDGQPLSSFGGTYAFGAGGLLQYRETTRSQQICYRGECQPNTTPDAGGADYVTFDASGAMVMTDAQTGESFSYRRVDRP